MRSFWRIYETTTNTAAVALCHCQDCQRSSGAAFSVNVLIPSEGFVLEGASLKAYETVGKESGETRRYV